MLNLSLSDEHGDIAELARAIGMDVLDPAARDAEEHRRVPDDVWNTLFETGLTTPVPEAHGGGGVPDALTWLLAVEALAHGDAGITFAGVGAGAGGIILGACGTQDQAATLEALAADALARCPVALYEGFGRSPSEFSTRLTRNTDATWTISGRKIAVPDAVGNHPMIVVGTDEEGRTRAAIVACDAAGVEIEADPRHLGLDAAPTHAVVFDTTVSGGALVGGEQCDAAALDAAVSRLRLSVAAMMLGCATRSIEYASAYASERIAFGKPIAAFQGVSFLLAESKIRIEAARLGVNNAASHDNPVEDVVTNAVNYAGVASTQATRDAIQVLGGHGFITDHPVELWYRSVAALSVLDFDPLRSAFEPAL